MTGGHNTRISLATLMAVKAGQRPRLVFRVHDGRRRRGDKRKGLTETDYIRLLDAAHQQLGEPLVLVRDSLSTHVSRVMRELAASRDWLTVYQFPGLRLRAQAGRRRLVSPEAAPGQPRQAPSRTIEGPNTRSTFYEITLMKQRS